MNDSIQVGRVMEQIEVKEKSVLGVEDEPDITAVYMTMI
jgi:hypothetical protein